jgi:hypothetical protein
MSLARDLATKDLSRNQKVLRAAHVVNEEGVVHSSAALQQFLLKKYENEFVTEILATRPYLAEELGLDEATDTGTVSGSAL